MMEPCPHCGSDSGFLVAARAVGPVEHHYGLNGELIESVYDKMRSEPYSTVVRCVDCYRIRHDVERDGIRIIEKEGSPR
jgi:hypothetical protein